MPPKSKKAIQLRKEINGAVNKNDLLIIQALLELNKPSTLIEIVKQLGLGTNQSQTDQPDFIETVSDTLQKAVTCGFIQMIDKRFYLYPITVTKSMKAISGDYDRSRSKRVNRNTWNTCKTITGLTFRDGVIIAIDIRRKTSSKIPSGRSKEIFRLQDNIYAAGVGFADDKKTLADLLHAKLDRHRMKMAYKPYGLDNRRRGQG
ncbi:uncharacterized protein LOC111070412 isoform X2 [Drosophila obscura]|uniref:uncharacterized protein LOC111070412 isoform X2 n=1 Tax=Drosophila obscura TaxID=7282 RepID=UPI001BB2B85B|nr:uncharacterized protein LOC111070412 isoform X2 [Drosophila obscura]